MKLFRLADTQRPLALRSTLIAVTVALLVSALASVVFTMALNDSFASGLVTFATFGSLAALTAGVLAWELASRRACPRCGIENRSAGRSDLAACVACGYDLRRRPRYACTEGHAVAYEPGLCDCGRRLLELHPIPVGRHVARAFWLAVAVFAGLLLIEVLLSYGN